MKCLACNKVYMGQTGRKFNTRYKEHIHNIRHNNGNTGYSEHILNTGHTYGTMKNTIDIVTCYATDPTSDTKCDVLCH
jgi:hypothetical protein